MAAVDPSEELKSLETTMGSIEAVLDLDKIRADIAVLEEEAAAPALWDDVANAQKVTSRLSFLQGEVRKFETLRGRVEDLGVLFELAEAGGRRGHPRRGRGRADVGAEGGRGARGPHPALGRVRTPARPWSTSGPRPAAWTPPTSPSS
ncbi:hypothetical protein GCM10020229_14980 [Kitasatospora albolonga]